MFALVHVISVHCGVQSLLYGGFTGNLVETNQVIVHALETKSNYNCN